jgi:hypothetical protein
MSNFAKAGGILSLVGAGFSMLAALACLVFIAFMFYLSMNTFDAPSPMEEYAIIGAVYGIGALFFVVMGVLGIVGGVFALKKKNWGMALTAAIAGTFAFFPCGVAAIVFTALGKGEFKTVPQNMGVQYPSSQGY